MDLTYIFIQKENGENKNNSPVKTKYFAKTSDTETSEVYLKTSDLTVKYQKYKYWS